jgi:fructose-bisphosphate aldolase class II
VNIASDGWVALTAVVRKVLRENPSVVDPRKYLGAARDELERLYMRKNAEIFGSGGKG